MLIKLREQLHDQGAGSSGRMERFAYRLWSGMLRRPWLYRLATWLATRTIGRWKRRDQWLSRLPGKLRGWTEHRDSPAPASRRFRDWWNKNQ